METGWPRAQLELTELLPAASGLRAIADDGPRALADQRIAPLVALLVGRSHAARPVAGRPDRAARALRLTVGRAGPGSGGVLAGGQRRIFAARAARGAAAARRVPARGRAGRAAHAVPDRGSRRGLPARRGPASAGAPGTLLVLAGAPRERVLEAALWAGFGRHPAAAGRIVPSPGAVPGLVEALTGGGPRRCASAIRATRRPPSDRSPTRRPRVDRAGPVVGLVGPPTTPRFHRAAGPGARCWRSWRRRTPRRRSRSPRARAATGRSRSGRAIRRRASASPAGCRRRRRGSAATGSRRPRCRPGWRATPSRASSSGAPPGRRARRRSPPITTSSPRSGR